MARHVVAKVSQAALRHNLAQIRKLAPQSKIMAMVKANAYGHGLINSAKTLQSADALGVASINEALRIREQGIHTEIVLMEGIFHEDELPLIHKHHLTQVVHHMGQVNALQSYRGEIKEKFKVWIKIDTGMNRLGFSDNEFEIAYACLKDCHGIQIIGFMTHFAQADNPTHPLNEKQIQRFEDSIYNKEGKRCLANSAAILSFSHIHHDWIRPGLLLYGATPFIDKTGKDFNLKPAMSLHAKVIALKTVLPKETVGYSGMWESTKPSRVAIVAIGYGDGYPWQAKNGTPVLVNNQRAFTVGRVSMDMLAIDVTNLENVEIGSPVILWGDENLPIEEVAKAVGTIPYELFCRFTERVSMQFMDE